MLFFNISRDRIHNCSICPLVKPTHLPFKDSESHALVPFDIVHLDVWRPYRVPTMKGYRYFLTVFDDCTRTTLIFVMRNKSEVVLHIKNFLVMIKNQFHSCRSLFQELDIVHQTSSFTQQNGRVE